MLLIDRWPIACRRAESHTGLGPTFTPRTTAIIYRGAPSGSSRRTSTPSTVAVGRLGGWAVGEARFKPPNRPTAEPPGLSGSFTDAPRLPACSRAQPL